MSSIIDARSIPETKRHAAADRIRAMKDISLPDLEFFNTSPCSGHVSLAEGMAQIPPCRRCGVNLRKHQKIGVAWLYMRGRGLIADQVGTGKTAQAAGLLAWLKQTGELASAPAVIAVRPSVLRQWVEELARFVPQLRVATATGDLKTRMVTYQQDWDVLVTGFQMFTKDHELLGSRPIGTVIIDDVDPLRNPSNSTAYALKKLAARAARAVVLTATPLQKRLPELHSVLEPVGALDIFGSATAFRRRYLREDLVRIYSPKHGRAVKVRQLVGYQNLDELKEKIAPLVLRRTPADIDDVDLPAISSHNVFLDLHAAQKTRYAELRKGVLRIIKAEGSSVKQTTAAEAFLHGAQICGGLATLGEADGPGASVKLDWVVDHLTGDLAEEKVVVFCQFTATVQALMSRLNASGVDHVTIWGRQPDRQVRQAAIDRFWDDPACRVLIGTSAIEQGMNLQVARHLINVDQVMNPARMQQLAGRIRRDGSTYQTVYVHNLLARATQEESYMDLLCREQALADHVWDEANQLFEALHPLALLELIGKSGEGK